MSEVFIYNISPICDRHDVSRALASILHGHPFNTLSPVPLNFDVVLVRPDEHRKGLPPHNGTGLVTLPTLEVGNMLLGFYGPRGPRARPQRTCMVGDRRIGFQTRLREPRPDVVQRILRQPYQDSKALEDQERRVRELSSTSVAVKTLQFGWDCRDGVYSIEWEYDVTNRAMLWFSDENKQMSIRIRHGPAIAVVSIRYALINALSACTHGGTSAIWTSLSAEPVFVLEKDSSGSSRSISRKRQAHLPFHGHSKVAPYTSLAIRLVLPSPHELQKFRRLAGVAQLHSVHGYPVIAEKRGLFSHDVLAEFHLWLKNFPYRVSFQLEATLKNLLVTAKEMLQIIPRIGVLNHQYGSPYTARFLRLFRDRVSSWWNRDDLDPAQKTLECCFERALADFELQSLLPDPDSDHERNVVYSYKATHTATRMLLDGPFPEQSNRVLRAYPAEHHDCFLRVSFMDDGQVPYRYDRDLDSRGYVRFRVGGALQKGLDVAGKKFEFLAYSLSALKEHTVWFVTPFECRDRRGETIQVNAARIIESLGVFDDATRYCPARYAARISQAFTATDQTVIEVEEVTYGRDIYSSDGRYNFTDGAGTLSTELADGFWEELQQRKGRRCRSEPPRAYQVRFQGSKGMLSVDHKLRGAVIVLRPSMKKFDAPDQLNVEIVQAFDRPNAYFLNRPLITVLEGLNVPYSVFERYQDEAVAEVKTSTRDTSSTAKFFERYGLGTSFRASSVLTSLAKLGVNHITGDQFFSRSLTFAENHVLRDLKNHARIPVPKGVTLVGVADIHGALWGNEVYACIREPGGPLTYLEGPVLVSRSPVTHPGDVRVAHAIGKPASGSSFAKEPLPNMLVFSTRGKRPLPSCLAGGDLDGDIYNVIPLKECPEFEPPPRRPGNEVSAATYDPAPKKILGRPSTMRDVADFVVDFINSNVLGLIANRWLTIADQSPHHVFDPDCMILSQLHSDAVDYQKSGQPVVTDKIPKAKFSAKPDWNAPETVDLATSATYYPSRRAIGRLFRRIDLPAVDPASEQPRQRRRQRRNRDLNVDDLAENVSKIDVLDSLTSGISMQSAVYERVSAFINTDEEPPKAVRDAVAQLFYYHAGVIQGICATNALSHRRTSSLTEEEIFVGTIIEKTSILRQRRDKTTTMREHSDHHARYVRSQLLAAEGEQLGVALLRSWTAWQLSMVEQSLFGANTFGWVALECIFDTIKDMEDS